MEWTDQAIIISVKKHGEKSGLIHVLSKEHGLYAGIVRTISGKVSLLYQIGNMVEARWQARLPEHLGNFSFELISSASHYLMDDFARLTALLSACSLIYHTLPERHNEKALYHKFSNLLERLKANDAWQKHYVLFEMLLLSELGFGLDLTECAATGTCEDLIYVSPKSARAVSRAAGAPYASQLLNLPGFLLAKQDVSPSELIEALKLTKYFLDKHIFAEKKKPMPSPRNRLYELFTQVASANFVAAD